MEALTNKLNDFFHISERGSNCRTEIRAGFTTFITMAYILPVNISILTASGLESGAVFIATALSAIIGTLLMGLMAGLPFALAPGMGLNAFFAYTVVLTMGFSPAFALAAVLVEGLIFIVLSVTGIRTQLVKALPLQLRLAIAAGIGLFIMFIGLQNAGIVVDNPATLVSMTSLLDKPQAAMAMIGVAITVALWLKKVRGFLLLGIFITWGIGILSQLAGIYVPNPDAKAFSLIPSGIMSAPPADFSAMGLCFEGLGQAFSGSDSFLNFIIVTLTFLYIDLFDTLGTLTGVMSKAKLLKANNDYSGMSKAFLSDAIATTVGAVLGTSTVTTFVESAAGVAEGGKTGLTSVTVAALFFLSLFFYPLISTIPAFATAPALILVGVMMCEPLSEFKWTDLEALIPGVVTMIFMVVGYSISVGIMWGCLFYILTMTVVKKTQEISGVMWFIGALFILKIIFLG